MEDYGVGIVGAGIGGLALACTLASNGRKVCLLEAKPRVTPSKRALTLQPNGLEALQKTGLLDRVARIGAKITYVTWHEIGGGPLATLDYSILYHPHNYLLTVVPSELELVLRDAFIEGGGTIRGSTFFREIRRTGSGPVVVKPEKEGSPIEFTTRIIVGADGENSRVRQALQMSVRIKEYPDYFFFMPAGPAASIQREARQYLAREKMVGFFPTRGSTYIFYYFPIRRVVEFRTQGFKSFKNELAHIEPEVSEALGGLRSWKDVAYASNSRVHAKSWVTDQAALPGDAVHALDPSWAQGANLALQDSVALASTNERCSELDDFSAKNLKSYEKMRRQSAEFVQNGPERTAQLTTTESRFSHWLGKNILVRTGRNRELMRIALQASSGPTDRFTLQERIRFLI